jgi:hypothetical protein
LATKGNGEIVFLVRSTASNRPAGGVARKAQSMLGQNAQAGPTAYTGA